jgi:hypothetical protein
VEPKAARAADVTNSESLVFCCLGVCRFWEETVSSISLLMHLSAIVAALLLLLMLAVLYQIIWDTLEPTDHEDK